MKVILYLVVLAALAYGVMYMYNNDSGSLNRMGDSTAGFSEQQPTAAPAPAVAQ